MSRNNSFGVAVLGWIALASCATPPTQLTHMPESKRLNEEGLCKVRLTVDADGSVHDVSITQSTGYPRLDEACLEAFVHGGLLPATEDGKPIAAKKSQGIGVRRATDPTKLLADTGCQLTTIVGNSFRATNNPNKVGKDVGTWSSCYLVVASALQSKVADEKEQRIEQLEAQIAQLKSGIR